MPCDTRPSMTAAQRQAQAEALQRLQVELAQKRVRVRLSANGAAAFVDWPDQDRAGLTDVCAFRKLANAPELRRAIAAAEVRQGLRFDQRQLAAGVHSHDGGQTWHRGHS